MAALALQLFISDKDDIIVADSWRPQPGDVMPQMPKCFVGKRFGAGALSFNQIYDIVDQEGRSTEEALKVCRPTRAAQRSLAHEWKMYKNLGMLGQEYPAAHSHFLQAHRVVKHGNGVIAGIIMEKANGRNVVKTLSDPRFANARYVTALLRDILVALDVAQRVLGFMHYDLKLDNVMEHWCGDPAAGSARVLIDSVPQFKIFDLGTAVVYPDPFSLHRAVDDHLRAQRPEGAPILAEQRGTSRGAVVDRNSGEPLYEYSEPFCCVRIYHLWGRRKGDVFRVLCGLCRLLDDRVWPLEDLELVSLLLTVLEHATNGRRLKAKFQPKALLERRILGAAGAKAAAAAAAAAGGGAAGAGAAGGPAPRAASSSSSTGLSKAASLALLQQHCQLVLQPSRALTATHAASQLLPSASTAAALAAGGAAADGRRQGAAQQHAGEHQNQQQQAGEEQLGTHPPAIITSRQQLHTPVETPTATTPHAPGSGGVPGRDASPFAAATAQQAQPGMGAASSGSAASARGPVPAAAGGQHTPRNAGGQYTPRRSTEVPRKEFVTTTASGKLESILPGVTFVRLTKAATGSHASLAGGGPDAAAAGPDVAPGGRGAADQGAALPAGQGGAGHAANGIASGGASAADGPRQLKPGGAAVPAPPAGTAAAARVDAYSAWVSSSSAGGGAGGAPAATSTTTTGAGAAAAGEGQLPAAPAAPPGVLQMVPSEQRKRQPSVFNALLLQQQQQQQQQQDSERRAPAVAAKAAPQAAAAPRAGAAATAAAAEPAGAAASSARAASGDEGGAGGGGGPAADNHACMIDNAGAIVRHQPMAVPAQQSVLGSRKALRGVTAQQLLVEPVVQSLLSKV